jgi:Zn finger protein HypA/HybF involved in hydrogenase expression
VNDTEITLQKIIEKYRPNIKFLRISLRCAECGHEWGVKVSRLESMPSEEEIKFICFECAKRRKVIEV